MLLETQLEMLNNDDWDKLIELEDEVDEPVEKRRNSVSLTFFSLLHIILNNIFIKKNEDRDKYLFHTLYSELRMV